MDWETEQQYIMEDERSERKLNENNYDNFVDWKEEKHLTEKQRKLAEMYAKKSRTPVSDVVKRLETGRVDFSELSRGILWVKLN